jgi:hypothetical protein
MKPTGPSIPYAATSDAQSRLNPSALTDLAPTNSHIYTPTHMVVSSYILPWRTPCVPLQPSNTTIGSARIHTDLSHTYVDVGCPEAWVKTRVTQLPYSFVQGIRHVVWIEIIRLPVLFEEGRVKTFRDDRAVHVVHIPVSAHQ